MEGLTDGPTDRQTDRCIAIKIAYAREKDSKLEEVNCHHFCCLILVSGIR